MAKTLIKPNKLERPDRLIKPVGLGTLDKLDSPAKIKPDPDNPCPTPPLPPQPIDPPTPQPIDPPQPIPGPCPPKPLNRDPRPLNKPLR